MSLKNVGVVLNDLANQNRRILTPWRAMIALKGEYPANLLESKAKQAINQMLKSGLIEKIAPGYFFVQVLSPGRREVNPYEIVMESYPAGVLSYSTALMIHGLTDQRFKVIHVVVPDQKPKDWRPLDVSAIAWDQIKPPPIKRLTKIDDLKILIHKTKADWLFGSEIIRPEKFALRVADLEKTLVDGLRAPKYSGGLDEVFKAWVRSLKMLDVDKVVFYTEKYKIGVLYQRVGFVLQTLGLSHPHLELWRDNFIQRGGSRVLDPEKPFSKEFDPDWMLSINHPASILESKDASYS